MQWMAKYEIGQLHLCVELTISYICRVVCGVVVVGVFLYYYYYYYIIIHIIYIWMRRDDVCTLYACIMIIHVEAEHIGTCALLS